MSKKLAIIGLSICALLFVIGLTAMFSENPTNLLSGLVAVPFIIGATLTKDTYRDKVVGDINELAVIASDIIYEGAAVGKVKASGHARPLTSVDEFVGFAEQKADNSAGSAADINVRVVSKGVAKLSVSGAVITDVGQPVYATDDDTFVFLPTGGVYIGRIRRFVSSGVVEVEYDAIYDVDPYGDNDQRETISVDKTLDALDTGKIFFVTVDAKTITVPATATALHCKIVNMGPYGTVAVNISPQAADKVMGPDIAGTDNKDLINTKATARRGDFAEVKSGHTDGYTVTDLKGIWAEEA